MAVFFFGKLTMTDRDSNEYIFKEMGSSEQTIEDHTSMLELLVYKLNSSTFESVQITTPIQGASEQVYYEVYRKDFPEEVFYTLFK